MPDHPSCQPDFVYPVSPSPDSGSEDTQEVKWWEDEKWEEVETEDTQNVSRSKLEDT